MNEEICRLKERLYCLEEIIGHISEGILLTDRACRITAFNPAKEEMEKMKASEVMERISWEAYSHSSREISEHQRVFDTREPILNAYRPHAYVDDMPVYINYSTYPVIRDDEVLGVYTISRNETMLKRLLYETVELKRQLARTNAVPVGSNRLAKGTHFNFATFVGQSAAIQAVIREAQTIATLDTPILITGETGAGKEVLAQSIHNFVNPDKKYVAVNCAAIPENLVESIMFGSKKGAYTGATDAVGLFEEAADGTLFLDEINSMSTQLQAKLLRALQERRIRPVGSAREIPIRCRLIFASNEQPITLVKENRLRQDLFYRISGFCLSIPPLRERREDIIELAYYFINRDNRQLQKGVKRISDDLAAWMERKDWPGNTRELQQFIQNIMLRIPETKTVIDRGDVPDYLAAIADSFTAQAATAEPDATVDYRNTSDLNSTLRELQREIVLHALEKNRYNITRTAGLGILRQNLLARMTRLQIERPVTADAADGA